MTLSITRSVDLQLNLSEIGRYNQSRLSALSRLPGISSSAKAMLQNIERGVIKDAQLRAHLLERRAAAKKAEKSRFYWLINSAILTAVASTALFALRNQKNTKPTPYRSAISILSIWLSIAAFVFKLGFKANKMDLKIKKKKEEKISQIDLRAQQLHEELKKIPKFQARADLVSSDKRPMQTVLPYVQDRALVASFAANWRSDIAKFTCRPRIPLRGLTIFNSRIFQRFNHMVSMENFCGSLVIQIPALDLMPHRQLTVLVAASQTVANGSEHAIISWRPNRRAQCSFVEIDDNGEGNAGHRSPSHISQEMISEISAASSSSMDAIKSQNSDRDFIESAPMNRTDGSDNEECFDVLENHLILPRKFCIANDLISSLNICSGTINAIALTLIGLLLFESYAQRLEYRGPVPT